MRVLGVSTRDEFKKVLGEVFKTMGVEFVVRGIEGSALELLLQSAGYFDFVIVEIECRRYKKEIALFNSFVDKYRKTSCRDARLHLPAAAVLLDSAIDQAELEAELPFSSDFLGDPCGFEFFENLAVFIKGSGMDMGTINFYLSAIQALLRKENKEFLKVNTHGRPEIREAMRKNRAGTNGLRALNTALRGNSLE